MVFAAIAFSFPFCHAFPPRACLSAPHGGGAPLCAIEVNQLRWPCFLAWLGVARLGWRQAGIFQRAESTEFTKLTHRRRRNCINISSQYNTAWTYKVCYSVFFLRLIAQFFTQTYTNCYVSS